MRAAVEHDDVELLELLLKLGIDINTRDEFGNTALCYAIMEGNDFLRDYLLQKGANPNISNAVNLIPVTPLSRAISYNDAKAIKSLIKHDADITPAQINYIVDHGCFDLTQNYYQHIKTVLLILNNLGKAFYNNRFRILSYLPQYHCHAGLYKKLQEKKYELHSFGCHVLDGHTKIIQEMLYLKRNKDKKNILEFLPSVRLLYRLTLDSSKFQTRFRRYVPLYGIVDVYKCRYRELL